MQKRTVCRAKRIGISALLLSLAACQSPQQPDFDTDKAAEARLKLGLAYLAEAKTSPENIRLAYQNLAIANRYAPDNTEVMLGLALFDQYVGQNGEADLLYKKITERAPENGAYAIHYGTFLCVNNRYQEAIAQFGQWIESTNYQWRNDSLEQAGYCAIQHNDVAKANEMFKSLFASEPDKRRQVTQIAQLYHDNGELAIANYLLNISKK